MLDKMSRVFGAESRKTKDTRLERGGSVCGSAPSLGDKQASAPKDGHREGGLPPSEGTGDGTETLVTRVFFSKIILPLLLSLTMYVIHSPGKKFM